MNAKPVMFTKLDFDSVPYFTAKLEAIARYDTIHGGASAMRIASDSEHEITMMIGKQTAADIVSCVYSASSGKPSEQFSAWECNECGSIHLGKESADICCAPDEWSDEQDNIEDNE